MRYHVKQNNVFKGVFQPAYEFHFQSKSANISKYVYGFVMRS